MWYFNNKLKKIGAFISLQEALCLQIKDIQDEQQLLSFQRGNRHVAMNVPNYIWEKVIRNLDTNNHYVFFNKYGGPLSENEIERDFIKAGENVGIKYIRSCSLRPLTKIKSPKIESKDEEIRYHISDLEWEYIQTYILSQQTHKGRKSKQNLRLVLEAIIYHTFFNYPIRKLPKEYPNKSVVESQNRRWKSSGIMQKLTSYLKLK